MNKMCLTPYNSYNAVKDPSRNYSGKLYVN